MFCVDEVKLCCPMCKTKELHKDHNVVELLNLNEDNEIFSASEIRKHFADVLKFDDTLEKKIGDTIENIKSEGGKAKEQVQQTFIKAHDKLTEEEAKILKELENVCDKSCEMLQDNLKKLREACEYSITLNEVDSKTQGECSRLMELNLVSEMEKQRKTMEDLHKMKMTDLKIEWDTEGRKLSFTRNLFNGAPIPSNISFPVILGKGFYVAWDCDEGEMNEEDKAKIKYVIEMKKTRDEEGEWKEIYSGKEKKYTANGLDKDTEYNIRIKCTIGELHGGWSDVVNVKTKNYEVKINSTILSNEVNGNALENKLIEWCGTTNFELIYRGTRDGFKASDFHNRCDNKGKTLVLIKNADEHIFGGFASIPWASLGDCSGRQAPGSFLFTLTNMHGIQPTKFLLKDNNDGHAVCHESNDYGAAFGGGHDLRISSDCDTNAKSYSYFSTYNNTTGKGNSIFSSNTGNNYFRAREIEVFTVNV